MKKIVKNLSVVFLLQCAALTNSFAGEIKVKVGGLFEFQGAIVNPDKSKHIAGNDIKITQHNDHFGLFSKGNIFVDVSNQISDKTSYGAKMSIQATTRNNRTVPSFLYFTSQLGKIELGSNKTAAKALGISGYTNACSSDYSDWIALDPNKKNIQYIDSPISYLDTKMRVKLQTEYARKITYYSPEISGFQFGLSYIPDLSNAGYDLPGQETYYDIANYFYQQQEIVAGNIVKGKVKRVPYQFSVKDAIAGALSFKHNLDNDIGVKLALTIEKGNTIVKQEKKGETKVNDIKEKDKDIQDLKMSESDVAKYQGAKFTDLMSYTIGGEVKFKDFSLAASYTNAGDSFTSKELDLDGNNKSDCFIFGGRYNFDKLGTSVSYLTSDNKKNKFNAITVAMDYKLAEGLTPYAEFTRYKTDGIDPIDQGKDTQNGSVFILGAKLAF